MNRAIVVTGTDTGIGKTVFAAGLTRALSASYWKPIQSGLDEETDTELVRRLAAIPRERTLPEMWRLRTAASPHLSAEIDGLAIDPEALQLPHIEGALVVEGAGGLMVPLTRQVLYIDVFARWKAPLILCARTSLGTLNHTLLSVEALKRRDISLLGIALVGDPHPDNERTLREMTGVPVLGRLPRLQVVNSEALQAAFRASFPTASTWIPT